MCSFLGLKEKDQQETLDIGKINTQIKKGTHVSTELNGMKSHFRKTVRVLHVLYGAAELIEVMFLQY